MTVCVIPGMVLAFCALIVQHLSSPSGACFRSMLLLHFLIRLAPLDCVCAAVDCQRGVRHCQHEVCVIFLCSLTLVMAVWLSIGGFAEFWVRFASFLLLLSLAVFRYQLAQFLC